MNLTERLLPVALMGAEWVLWLLVILSVISVAIMIERVVYFRSTGIEIEALMTDLRSLLAGGEAGVAKARERVRGPRVGHAIEGQVVDAGLAEFGSGAASVEKAMGSARSRMRLRLERNLAFLGTVGNNAPFIGLFGTVIGVIKAFHDLASKRGQGPEAVMGSISEALIATAVGLLVAIPAVVAFNAFNRVVRSRVANADALAQLLLAQVSAERADAAVAGSKGGR